MGELATYFGNNIMADLVTNARTKHAEFYKQSKATKAELADDLKTKVGVYEQATPIILGCLEESSTKNKLKDKVIKAMEKEFGVSNLDFIKREQIEVVASKDLQNAKEDLLAYVAKQFPTGLAKVTKAQKNKAVFIEPHIVVELNHIIMRDLV